MGRLFLKPTAMGLAVLCVTFFNKRSLSANAQARDHNIGLILGGASGRPAKDEK